MAVEQGLVTRSYEVGADFSTSQYAVVGLTTTATLVFPTSAGAKVIGVIQSGTSSGFAEVAIGGQTKVMTDGTQGINALVGATTLGRIGSSTGVCDYIIGMQVSGTTSLATGNIVSLEILHMLRSS